MKDKTVIPNTISGFTEYIKTAYDAAVQNEKVYGINPNELAKTTPLYNDFIKQEALCANPVTASKPNRDARNIAWDTLEKQWRVFLNKEIRLNDNISVADKEIFGILPHDEKRTHVLPPKSTGILTITRVGECRFDMVVEDSVTGKKKRPDDATGSNVYSAIVEPGQPVPHKDTFHFEGFSSTSHHTVAFSDEHIAKRAYLFARYSNAHGQEGPEGPVSTIIIN
jgi:hypothetical protein